MRKLSLILDDSAIMVYHKTENGKFNTEGYDGPEFLDYYESASSGKILLLLLFLEYFFYF